MKYVLGYILLLIILSCTSSHREPEKSEYEIRQEKEKTTEILNKDEAFKLCQKYNAISDWQDSISFTYKMQERLEDTLIAFTGFISDIVLNRNDPFKKYGGYLIKSDPLGIFKTYVLKVTSYNTECTAEILVNEIQLKKLESEFSKDEFRTGCFILKVSRIQSMLPVLSSEGDADVYGGNDEDGYDYNVNTNLTYEFEKVLIKFTGSIVDYYPYKKDNE